MLFCFLSVCCFSEVTASMKLTSWNYLAVKVSACKKNLIVERKNNTSEIKHCNVILA